MNYKEITLTSIKQEVIMMVGIQGSGKSTVAQEWLAKSGYVVLSNDALGGRDKTLSALRSNIEKGNQIHMYLDILVMSQLM